MDGSAAGAGTSLASLLQTLGATVATVVAAPGGTSVPLRSVALLESSDLEPTDAEGNTAVGDLCVVVGASAEQLGGWLQGLTRRAAAQRPLAVATKITTPRLAAAAVAARTALIAIHPQARIDLVLGTVRSLLEGAAQAAAVGRDDAPLGGESDLYGLAQTVAALTGGMVSIEDERSQLLAYSATDGAADELRMLSILGREGPADYLRRLREWGVYDRLQRERGVVEVPADHGLGWRRRLVVAIRPLGEGQPARGQGSSLGTIWLQEGERALDPDAGSVLEGAAAIAARLIERSRSAPTREALQIQRLLGLQGGGVDVPSVAAALSLPTTGPAAVVGIGPRRGRARAGSSRATPLGELAAAVRLHASAYAREALVATSDDRIYVLIPQARTAGLATWVGSTLDRLTRRTGVELRAAIAAPVADLTGVGAARSEVDRVLERPGAERVTTLAESRTTVLLGEIADLVAEHDELRDPRLQTLIDDDRSRDGSLLVSLERYLDRFGDVRQAANELHVHANTLRYRIRRAEQVLGMRLDDPEDRLLLQVQILRWRRHP